MPTWANAEHSAVVLDSGSIAPADERNRDYGKLIRDGVTIQEYAPVITGDDVDEEWTRRVFTEFPFNGKTYHADRDSIENILGAAAWALGAVINGVQAGNYYWQAADPDNPGPDDLPFGWKPKGESEIPMDAPMTVALGEALGKWKQAHYRAARVLKTMDPIPSDYKDDSYWP